jgi:ribosomal-protein-alanine N-acetyltransferase
MSPVSFTPFPVLHTERLILRAPVQKDAGAVFNLRTDSDTLKYLDRAAMDSIAEAKSLIDKMCEDAVMNEGINWAIALKANPDELIGTIGYWRLIKAHFRAEIGYMLLKDYTNQGLMKEALKAVIAFGFGPLKLHSIEANINPQNLASEKLLQSVGFIKEAYFRENYFYDGKFSDSVIYSLINSTE